MSSKAHRLYLRQPFSLDEVVLPNYRCRLSVEEFLSRRLFGREDAQEVTGTFQGSPRKKGQGQDLALTPVK